MAGSGDEEGKRRLELLERDASVGRLTAGVAHDLNNVLATISVLATMLRNSADDSKRPALLDQIVAAVESASRLTRGLLEYGRRESGGPALVMLDEVVREVTALVGRATGSRVQFRVEPGARRLVLGDRSRLGQVVMNLVVNARDAIQGEGVVTIRTADVDLTAAMVRGRGPLEPGGYVTLLVSDTGPGIDPEIRGRVFEPYFTTKTDGTGLGLSIARRIVEEHRGLLELGEGPLPGATLRVYLPVAPPASR